MVTSCTLLCVARVLLCSSNKLKFHFVHSAMEGLENMAFVANALSLVTYFSGYMNFNITKSATTLTNFMGTAFLLPLLGGIISDTYISRFKTCVLFACLELLVSWTNFCISCQRWKENYFQHHEVVMNFDKNDHYGSIFMWMIINNKTKE